MHWQKTGDYLCVKVDRYSKLRKEKEETKYAGLYCNFEVFHMREKQIPVSFENNFVISKYPTSCPNFILVEPFFFMDVHFQDFFCFCTDCRCYKA